MPKVVVVGDANVDIIVPYPRFLNEERTQVEYPQIGIEGGGTSANTAVALAKLGLDVSFVGTVGDDQYGRFVMQERGTCGDGLANGNRSRCSTKTLCRCT